MLVLSGAQVVWLLRRSNFLASISKALQQSELCKWFEAKQLQEGGPGLYRWHSLTDALKLEKVPGQKIPATNKPVLLFIHGTGSSSAGGFGKLWSEARNPVSKPGKHYKTNMAKRVTLSSTGV